MLASLGFAAVPRKQAEESRVLPLTATEVERPLCARLRAHREHSHASFRRPDVFPFAGGVPRR